MNVATHNHEVLKLKAIEWLYQVKKCKWVAPELKFGQYVYDVVGTDGFRIYIIEAKRSYNDFKKDCNNPETLKENIKQFKELLKETGDTDYQDKIKKEKAKSTKFFDQSIFKLANEAYIIAPDELIPEGEVPEGWGLISDMPQTTVVAPKRKVDKKWIQRVLGEIGKKHTKMYLKGIGVEFQGKKVVFPERYLLNEDREIEEDNTDEEEE